MRTEHAIEVYLDRNRVLHADVECEWTYETNPYDKEIAHYNGENDGYYRDSERITNIRVNESLVKEADLSIRDQDALEKAITKIGVDDP